MPALNITAVDHVTDQLTIPAHGQVTGNGPAAIRNIGGDLPDNLAAVTDYWLIVLDANTVKLADSSADAMAGIARAINDNGSGDNVLELGIPYVHATTYVPKSAGVPGSQLKSQDLNDMQRSFKALHALLTGQAQTVWDLEDEPIIIPGGLAVSAVHTPANTAGGYRYGYTLIANTAPVTYLIPQLRVGDVITGYAVILDKASVAGTAVYQGWIKSYDAPAAAEANESPGTGIQDFGGASGPGTALSETGLEIEIEYGKQYYIAADPSADCTNDVLQHAVVYVRRTRL